MNRRTLIIHAGGGKAGSSALQSALSSASEDLAKHGISYVDYYPRSSAYEITTGNGFRLFEEIGRPTWETSGKETIEFFLGDNPVGICSSEFLGALTRKRWGAMIHAAREIGVELKIVYFVRGALGYVASSYHQNVKRSGEARPFSDTVTEYPWQHYHELQNLSTIFDADHLRVINYDRVREKMGEAFAGAYPELAPVAELLGERGKLPVNRSLTCAELEVICRVNDRFASLYSHDLSDKFLYEAPDINVPTNLPGEMAGIIAGKFRDATSWINERFFPDGDGLSLELDEAGQRKAPADPIERPLRIAFEWALDAIENRSTEINFIRERLLAIDWERSEDSSIPAGFDPIAYLLLNPDVLRSQIPPYQHFIQSGHCEPREYRWPLSVTSIEDAAGAGAINGFPPGGGEPLGPVPTWTRLRHSIQLEGLLHQFAQREHEYLALVSNRETQGDENEQFGQAVSQMLHPFHDLVEGLRRETKDGTDYRTAEMQVLIKLAQDLTAQVGGLWQELARLSTIIQSKDQDMLELNNGFLEMIARKDEQLAQQNEELARYREASFPPIAELNNLEGHAQVGTMRVESPPRQIEAFQPTRAARPRRRQTTRLP